MDDQPQPDLHASDDDQDGVEFTPREIEMIAEGLTSMEAFGTIPVAEAFAWLESLGTTAALPMPQPRME